MARCMRALARAAAAEPQRPAEEAVGPGPRAPAPEKAAAAAAAAAPVVTVEFQRRAAKEMAAWLEQEASARKAGADAGPRLGWVPGAEKLNGRWVMMGFLIGLITEYSTGVNFIDQVLLALTNMGVLDLEV